MTFGRWLWDKTVPVVLNICGIIAVALFTGFSAEWYIAAVIAAGWIAALAAYLAVGYVSEKRRVARVRSVVLSAEDKFLLSEIVPEPTRVEDRLYYEIMRLQGRAAIERVSAAEAAAEERKEDIEEWVHELKIPLTAIRLICSRSDGEDFREVAEFVPVSEVGAAVYAVEQQRVRAVGAVGEEAAYAHAGVAEGRGARRYFVFESAVHNKKRRRGKAPFFERVSPLFALVRGEGAGSGD